ncbi:MAG: hypothetical protein SGCHY_005428, partial [Lobulomycetales sp.]
WGEFEIQIKLHFVPELNEKPVTISHHLQLYPKPQPITETTPLDANGQPTPPAPVPVLSQQYDELVFNDPHPGPFKILSGSSMLKKTPMPPDSDGLGYDSAAAVGELAALNAASTAVKAQIEEWRVTLAERAGELEELKMAKKEAEAGGDAMEVDADLAE